MSKLLIGTDVVEAPFITVQIGDYILGCFKNSLKNGQTVAKVNAPNYTKSINIIKINGAVSAIGEPSTSTPTRPSAILAVKISGFSVVPTVRNRVCGREESIAET